MIGELVGAGAAAAVLGLSARWNWWRLPARGLPVLMYHKVGTPPPGSRLRKLWVLPAQFRSQMDYLKRRGYEPVTLRRVADALASGGEIPARWAVITFDDGYRNNIERAFPILREYGFPATLFVVVEAIGRDNFWHDPANEARIPMLGWEEVKALRDAGWEIGSHTLTHPRLAALDPAAAVREIAESRRLLGEVLGEPPVSFAYPYGNGADDLRLRLRVQDAGYRLAVSVHQGKAQPLRTPFALRRLFIRGDDTRLDFHLNMTRGRARL